MSHNTVAKVSVSHVSSHVSHAGAERSEPTMQSCILFSFFQISSPYYAYILSVLKHPSVHIPGFHSSAMRTHSVEHCNKPVSSEGYQHNHKELAQEYFHHAALAKAKSSGEFVHVEAVLAYFQDGARKPVMIRVCSTLSPYCFSILTLDTIYNPEHLENSPPCFCSYWCRRAP